ncbi:cysteine peptidase family C39 domain-containing protein [Candidatus Mycoplasma haematohominis]|uniref:cysteine peptidase family C39 domain-containing protein n=1 Tax=Candidatus Mycoplasma haematohominis TaxID=1494318 RepID=UPI001C0A6B46|nr:cysteine peptidase family C39 domain-containing protein [Candidatus Mycoplasma haemohominis]
MKIYYQTNNNDCGIAVTQSLIQHFFQKEISKEELFQKANIKEEGLSILDLELLNKNYGLHLESYSMDFDEFKEYESQDYFVLVINRNGERHYTIANKKGEKVTLFDSALGQVVLSIEEVKEIWLDLFISVKPIQKNLAETNYFSKKEKVNVSNVFLLFVINLVVLFLSVTSTYLIRYSFSHVQSNHELFNLLKVLFVVVLVYGIFHFGEFLEELIVCENKNKYSKDLYGELVDTFNRKKNSYFHKLGKNQFLLLKDHIDYISTYHSEFINKWLISVFTLVAVSIFLICNSWYFVILIVGSFLVQTVFWKLSKKIYFKYFPVLNELQNEGKRLLYAQENLLKLEVNAYKLGSLGEKCKENYFGELDVHKDLDVRQNIYSKINSYLNNLVYVFVFSLVAYYIFVGDLDFGYLMIMNLFYFHLGKSFNSLINYYGFRVKYDYSKKIYSQMLNVDTFDLVVPNKVEIPKKIAIKNLFFCLSGKVIFNDLNLEIVPNTFIYGPSGTGKSILYKIIVKKLNPAIPSVWFDDQETSSIDDSLFRELCIYQISDSYIDPGDLDLDSFTKLFPNLKKSILEICSSMNLDVSRNIESSMNLSSGQRQLINILSLLKYKNKVLLLDEIASHINSENRFKIYKEIIPFISSRNFLICSEHTPELKALFSNSIDLSREHSKISKEIFLEIANEENQQVFENWE